ncbi:5-formyltetrahydrofolate cyclo-ligase [Moellerella wisconsensis]|uniref:5-formyltetrahydrofolate cyclo-ligase n=2 Tax=Moellerella wisconsensis TaxID=158849 RepID=A0ACD3Y4U0_9GAMM|nr:5-formyltetrahydrofolate cyclo-ligase [Moellerella wisconsensis]KLN97601.1 5-formyltetrahydrofolate cyclo-ligase [Moellerella wisconsensis]UNH26451.1 5-formyltetrahydrofolate cyclo-ligase [Moellerella wisconsensis]UNH29868.1 5-formyltetrahydrofolate cyclo-ligase [Moellerella wisconsensis]UNH38093.1 5-formyltetrahydrofolate cyclo-ligase [Moellerella wisconsensis]UNH41586.1 5-formyltetrahydrofolate cyclo-ligase [Moellerella wisconsensis]
MLENDVQLRKSIRQQIRQKRQQLTKSQQQQAAQYISQQVLTDPKVQSAQTIALFLSFDGEIDTMPLIQQLWQRGKQVYLPVLHPFNRHSLLFLAYTPTTQLIKNRFNIQQPALDVQQVLPLNQLDIMLIPLVAFDLIGQRLGMGGGFYDRILAGWQQKGFYPIGLAHQCQQVDKLPSATWDIPLPEIITPQKIWRW